MHKLTGSLNVAARMWVVLSFLIFMPCWAIFWLQGEAEVAHQDVAKVITEPASAPPHRYPLNESAVDDRLNSSRSDSSFFADGRGERRPIEPDACEPLVGLQRQLQDRGAQYMLLRRYPSALATDPARSEALADTAGGRGSTYHFVCRMPIPTNPLYERTFEASAGDPVEAMYQVLREVQRWQGLDATSGAGLGGQGAGAGGSGEMTLHGDSLETPGTRAARFSNAVETGRPKFR